jgi:probable HAF family extracellular repeat protein
MLRQYGAGERPAFGLFKGCAAYGSTTPRARFELALALMMYAVALLPVNCAIAAPRYSATPLSLGGTFSLAYGISANGSVAGYSQLPGNAGVHNFLYRNSSIIDLDSVIGPGWAMSVNSIGEVTGSTRAIAPVGSSGHAYVYGPGGLTDLGTLGGTYSIGYAINDAGQVAGFSYTNGDTATRAFLYSHGMMDDLGTLGGASSSASDLNSQGDVTGYALTTGNSALHAFVYSQGAMTDLGTLGGTWSQGLGISDSKQIAGYSAVNGDTTYHAFLATTEAIVDLGTLGGTYSVGFGVNRHGMVVGYSATARDLTARAFLYLDSTMTDLNMLVASGLGGATLTEARDINDAGQIVAVGCLSSGVCSAYLLNPDPTLVPEPRTFVLITIGLAGIRVARRKRDCPNFHCM